MVTFGSPIFKSQQLTLLNLHETTRAVPPGLGFDFPFNVPLLLGA